MANKAISSLSFDSTNNYVMSVPYGSCSTAIGTQAKTVSVGNFSLETGAIVAVKFTKGNSHASPTLNVSSTGAKSIYYKGAALSQGLEVNGVYTFIYNGSQWDLIGEIDTDTNTQTITGVKGNAETSYRTGNVNITAANIGLATVATSGSYNDLSNKPTIPSAYTLPNATSSTLGGVKVGSNITVSSGTISLTKSNVTAALGYTPPTSDTNTDTLMTQAYSTSNASYPMLMSATSGVSSTSSRGATTSVLCNKIYGNPYSGRFDASTVYGAVWNDYAEYREGTEEFEPGRVICENGDDTLSLATERLQPGANVVSDTFGFAIGETEKAKTPIAVSGRVLVYPYEDRNSYKPGDAVCAAPGGTVSKMTREEIREYPERILGTVSAIPTYERWGEGDVPVNGRIWIKVR